MCLHVWIKCIYISVCVSGVHFAHAGLGDNYGKHHLFSGMRYNNKRLRANSQLRKERGSEMEGGERERGTEGWRTTEKPDSTSLTSLID